MALKQLLAVGNFSASFRARENDRSHKAEYVQAVASPPALLRHYRHQQTEKSYTTMKWNQITQKLLVVTAPYLPSFP